MLPKFLGRCRDVQLPLSSSLPLYYEPPIVHSRTITTAHCCSTSACCTLVESRSVRGHSSSLLTRTFRVYLYLLTNSSLTASYGSLKERGVDVSQHGLSVKTDKKLDREHYLDATQRSVRCSSVIPRDIIDGVSCMSAGLSRH